MIILNFVFIPREAAASPHLPPLRALHHLDHLASLLNGSLGTAPTTFNFPSFFLLHNFGL